jgi:hypothetical protein
MNVNIKALKKDNTGCLIAFQDGNEDWFNFADYIKPQFIKIGPASVSIDEESSLITFCKMLQEGNEKPKNSFKKANSYKPSKDENEDEKTKMKVFLAIDSSEIENKYNELTEKINIVATQFFPVGVEVYDMFIYYK